MYLSKECDERGPQRRQHARYGIQCRARIQIGKRHYAGYIQDISEAGAKLRTVSSIRRLGDVILRLPDLPSLKCQLRWTDAYHAGVVFELPLTKEQFDHWISGREAVLKLNQGPELDCELVEAVSETTPDQGFLKNAA